MSCGRSGFGNANRLRRVGIRTGHAPRRPILNIIRVILAILLPPLGVLLTVGLGLHFWLNILLTIFGYIPGIVHAVWIISSRAKERELR